jgi:hypothetical protein
VALPWKLASSVTLYPGQTTTMVWRYPHVNPYTGATEGDWRGPQHAYATPVQLSTFSGRVNTLNQGFDHTSQNGVSYYADITCVSGGSGTFEVWVQGLL